MLIGKHDRRLKEFIEFMIEADKSRTATGIGSFWTQPDDDRFAIWSIIEEDNQIVSCSAVQPFDGNVARMLTRFCIHPDYRTDGLIQKKHVNSKTYAFQMIEEQLEYCKQNGFDHAFFSTEYNRYNVIKRHIRIAKSLGYDCKLLDAKYNTCKLIKDKEIKDRPDCWQNICLYPLSDKEFPLVKSPYHT